MRTSVFAKFVWVQIFLLSFDNFPLFFQLHIDANENLVAYNLDWPVRRVLTAIAENLTKNDRCSFAWLRA